jgi:hypothetical protein
MYPSRRCLTESSCSITEKGYIDRIEEVTPGSKRERKRESDKTPSFIFLWKFKQEEDIRQRSRDSYSLSFKSGKRAWNKLYYSQAMLAINLLYYYPHTATRHCGVNKECHND